MGGCTSRSGGHELFHCFSPNWPPFRQDGSYSKFKVFAMLKHGDNYSAAARELGARGYGGTRGHEETLEESLAEFFGLSGSRDPHPEVGPTAHDGEEAGRQGQPTPAPPADPGAEVATQAPAPAGTDGGAPDSTQYATGKGLGDGADSGEPTAGGESVRDNLYSEGDIQVVAHAPPEGGDPPDYRGIIARLRAAADRAFCRRPKRTMMDGIAGTYVGALICARGRCGGWGCRACHVINRCEWAERAATIADGTAGVDTVRRPLPVRLWAGTARAWRALDVHLTRLAERLGVPRHGWVRVQRRRGGDVVVLIFGGPDSPRLPDPPVSRLCAANVFAAEVDAIEFVDHRQVRGTRYYPVVESDDPRVFPLRVRPRTYAVVRDMCGRRVHVESRNAVAASGSRRAAAFQVEYEADGQPAGRYLGIDHSGYFGDRERRLNVVEALLDPEAADFLTCSLPKRYLPPGGEMPAGPPAPDGLSGAELDDFYFEHAPLEVIEEVNEVEPVRPPDVGLVAAWVPPEDVGPRLAAAAKWVTQHLPAALPPEADRLRRGLHWFVYRAERTPLGQLNQHVATEIEAAIIELRLHVIESPAAEPTPPGASAPPPAEPPPPEAEGELISPGDAPQVHHLGVIGAPDVPGDAAPAEPHEPTPVETATESEPPAGPQTDEATPPAQEQAPAPAAAEVAESDDALLTRIRRDYTDLPPAWLERAEREIRAARGDPARREAALGDLGRVARGWRAIPRGRARSAPGLNP